MLCDVEMQIRCGGFMSWRIRVPDFGADFVHSMGFGIAGHLVAFFVACQGAAGKLRDCQRRQFEPKSNIKRDENKDNPPLAVEGMPCVRC